MRKEIDIDSINAIPISDVLWELKIEVQGKYFICPTPHSKISKGAIYFDNNICKCHNCNEFQGSNINIVMLRFKCNFVVAGKWLHDNFNIPYKYSENRNYSSFYDTEEQKDITHLMEQEDYRLKQQKLESYKTKMLTFNPSDPFRKIRVEDFTGERYHKLDDIQKLKILYSLIYRFSLKTNQDGKNFYYLSRNIEDNPLTDLIGYLSSKDLLKLEKQLDVFPMEDLIKFNLYSEKDLKFKYRTINGFCVIPNFNLENDLISGFMLRNTYKKAKIKELQVSATNFIRPLPFELSREMLMDTKPIFITEGHIDALSIPASVQSRRVIALTGIHGFAENIMGLFKGKTLYICFDMDEAGRMGSEKLKNKLINHGVNAKVITWNGHKYGMDINDVLNNGHIDVFKFPTK